jgi:hypothetical protein
MTSEMIGLVRMFPVEPNSPTSKSANFCLPTYSSLNLLVGYEASREIKHDLLRGPREVIKLGSR